MKDYLLFIDTEASGLPKKWDLPYTAKGNWPFAVQVSWIIYNNEGIKIREQNHYVSNNDVEISPAAFRIHGLSKDFLQKNGIPRRELLALLSKDLLEYQPMIVGHFIELDYRIIAAEYCRERLDNPMESLPAFCIMLATKHLQQNPQWKFLRLGDLYELLFKQPLLCQHNAMADVAATADCYFELVKRKEARFFTQPPVIFQLPAKKSNRRGWFITLVLVLFSTLLITCYYG